MTYLQFHLVFLLPPLLAVSAALYRTPKVRRAPRWPLAALAVIAFAYTTPWDNYLVYRDVWSYGPERVLFTIGYVPFEEYLFFILQPLLTGAWCYLFIERDELKFTRDVPVARRWSGAAFFLLMALSGAALLAFFQPQGLYLGLILTWACPVLAGMWAYGGVVLGQTVRFAAFALLPPTVYLWIADWAAMQLGIWHISDATSFGLDPLGMPVEEATFFLVTNLLVIYGLLLFRYGDVIAAARTPSRATG